MGPLCPISDHRSLVTLLKFQMAPKLRLSISPGSKKKEPRYACLSEAKASHLQSMWAKVSSLTSYLLHSGLSSSRSKWSCLLRVLCPIRRPITTLDWVVLKVPRLGHEISTWACFRVSPRPCHFAQCWLTNQRSSLFCVSRLETPRAGLGPRNLRAAHRQFHYLLLQHVRGPNIAPIPGRDVILSLLALMDQGRNCSDGLESFQSCLTIRADTHVFLRSILRLNFINRGSDTKYLSLINCCISA